MAPTPPVKDPLQLWQATLDALEGSVAVVGIHGDIVAVNQAWQRFGTENGLGGGGGVGVNYLDVCETAASDEPMAGTVATAIADVLLGRRASYEGQYASHSPTVRRWFSMRVVPLGAGEVEADPETPGALVFHHNITEAHEAEQASLDHRLLVATTQASLAVTDANLAITQWSAAAEQLYGWTADEVLGRSLPDIVPSANWLHMRTVVDVAGAVDGGQWHGELDLPCKNGSRVQVDARMQLLFDGMQAPCGLVFVTHDLTEHKAMASELQLTNDFFQTVTQSMPGGLFVLDDDGSLAYMNKEAETLLGWTPDDAAADRIEDLWGADGGDGQAMSQLAAAAEETRAIGSPVRVLSDRFRLRNGTDLPVTYSVAGTKLPSGGAGVIVVFSDNSAAQAEADVLRRESETLREIARIKDALAEERFVMYAQPIVDLSTNRTVQHELLIRMVDRDGSIVPPIQFLPIAEEYGLIKEIDRYVIERAMRLAAQGHSVELNISAHSLSDSQLGAFVEERLGHYAVDPSLLVFEITETALVDNEENARQFVDQINALGCTAALDDFGTGYGSFHYLKHLPVQMLKIDREFVRDLNSDQTSRLVVEAVINLAQGLGKITVAEGIEDAETLATLRDLGVDHAQGYFLGRPAPASKVFGEPD